MVKKKGVPVVITRKDKRLNKTGHLVAFALTGGLSGAYTATKAATNAGYNARTRELQRRAEAAEAAEVPVPAGTVRPRGSGWTLIPESPRPVTDPEACPRCGRSGLSIKAGGGPGKPHTGMGRRWCPGAAEDWQIS